MGTFGLVEEPGPQRNVREMPATHDLVENLVEVVQPYRDQLH